MQMSTGLAKIGLGPNERAFGGADERRDVDGFHFSIVSVSLLVVVMVTVMMVVMIEMGRVDGSGSGMRVHVVSVRYNRPRIGQVG